jgi:hypothetical protein
LHGGEASTQNLLCEPDLVAVHVGDAREADRTGVQEVADGADGVGIRHLRVRAVQLVQADRLAAQALQRSLRRRLEMLGSAIEGPASVTGAEVSALGCDQHIRGVATPRRDRSGDQGLVVADLVCVDVIGIRRIEKSHTLIERSMNGSYRAGLIRAAFDRHGHAAQTDRTDLEIYNSSCLHIWSLTL